MKPARQVLAGIALGGTLVLLILFSRIDPAAMFRTSLDRSETIRRARQLASRYGVNASGWKVAATQLTDEKLRSYLAANPKDQAARMFTPLAWGVLLTDPAGTQTVRIKLFADGRPAEWEWKQPGSPNATPPAAVVTPETLLQDFAGSHAAQFVRLAGKKVQAWEWPAENGALLKAEFDVTEREGRLVSALLVADIDRTFDPARSRTGFIIVSVIGGLVSFGVFCVALVQAARACFRGRLSWRFPAGLVALMVLWAAAMAWVGPEYQALLYNRSSPVKVQLDDSIRQKAGAGVNLEVNDERVSSRPGYAGVLQSFLGPLCLPFLTGFAFAGAGYAAARGQVREKWVSFELMLRGKIFTRQVSRPIAAGALCGIGAAAAPYAAAIPFRGASLLFHSMGVLSAPLPFVALISLPAVVPAFGYFGFAFPLADRVRDKWGRAGMLGGLAAIYLFASAGTFNWLAPSLIAAALSLAIYFELYRRFDLLAVATAMMMCQAVAAPCILLAQPAAGLRESGVRLLVLLLAGTAAFVSLAIRGRDADVAEPAVAAGMPAAQAPSLSNRQRLEAEFQVARRAQQDALPAVPPLVDGYTFSGSCDPALQVGGDLYDLFPLPDGRIGVAVADVSGKGVPAALYMMVTKGLLTATAQDSSDLTHILQQINHHLYRVCKRKVFVTMAAVAVDPGRRRLEYARAGHNPIVWRRARLGQTVLRKPPGLGLGMCSTETFNRSLRLEELELEPGDAVVLYSDGITEAINASMDQFGEERLMESIEKTDGQPAEETRLSILRDLANFTDGTPARDDVTVVVLRVAE